MNDARWWWLALVGTLVGSPALAGEPSPSPVAGTVTLTPWPVALPCAHPLSVVFQLQVTDVLWQSRDGKESVTFDAEALHKPSIVLGRAFPVGRLDAIDGVLSPDGDVVSVVCTRATAAFKEGMSYIGDNALAGIQWKSCAGTCAVTVTYPIGKLPDRRAQRWIANGGRRLDKAFPEDKSPETLPGPATAVTRDMATDTLNHLRAACGTDRCSAFIGNIEARLSRLLAAERLDFRAVDNYVDAVERYAWNVVVGDDRFQVDCRQESFSDSLDCDLRIPLPGDSGLTFMLDGRILSFHESGTHIEFGRHGRFVTISGKALALRAAGPQR